MSQIRATARLPEIDRYIIQRHGRARPLNPREVAVIREEGNAQLRVIRQNWPVRTGASRAAWRFSIIPSPGRVAIVWHNRMQYASFITRKGSPSVAKGGPPFYQTLLRAVNDAGKARLIRRLKEEIDRSERSTEAATQILSPLPPRRQRARSVIELTRGAISAFR